MKLTFRRIVEGVESREEASVNAEELLVCSNWRQSAERINTGVHIRSKYFSLRVSRQIEKIPSRESMCTFELEGEIVSQGGGVGMAWVGLS
jgi:hypothetical protein